MNISTVSMKQTGVMIATMEDGTDKQFPLYDTNLLREVDDILSYHNEIVSVNEVYEITNLYEDKIKEETMITEKLMNHIRSGFDVPRNRTNKELYK